MSNTYILPLSDNAVSSFTTSLDSVDVTIRFVWNNRTKHHHMTVELKDGTPVIEGQKAVVGCPILTSKSFASGLLGAFYVVPVNPSIVETEDTRRYWASNYFLSYDS
jgi:hypothetical protein